MRERRHHGRLSSKFLPPRTSLYNAMQAIIGAGLQERYDIPEQLPSENRAASKSAQRCALIGGAAAAITICIGNGAASVITTKACYAFRNSRGSLRDVGGAGQNHAGSRSWMALSSACLTSISRKKHCSRATEARRLPAGSSRKSNRWQGSRRRQRISAILFLEPPTRAGHGSEVVSPATRGGAAHH